MVQEVTGIDPSQALSYVFTIGVVAFITYRVFRFSEMAYVEWVRKKLFFTHVNFGLKQVDNKAQFILRQKFRFYQQLTPKQRRYFEHRVAVFLKEKDFVGKGLTVTEEMKILIAATAVKMMFGFRDYKLQIIQRVLIYPEKFYSHTNEAYHIGEFNPKLQLLVFSWKDFEEGYRIEDDNLNLAVHEMVHAIHFNYLKRKGKSSSASIFLNSYNELISLLNDSPKIKAKMVESNYFRAYGFTNQYEFLAVLIENFIETPTKFKTEFPQVYSKVKQMLNFNFKGY